MSSILNSALLLRTTEFATKFQERQPFRHLVIDDFFDSSFCTELLKQFPAFERGNARNEAGELGQKSTVERIHELGAAYKALDKAIQSSEFLNFVSHLTGIPHLLYDPYYFGGGTHENREGQDLDAHVDFNRHPVERWHRRLNLIIYLNSEWQDEWGGSLELHTDPRRPDNCIKLITPLYNRCVIFETTEWSWHGFSRIQLPVEKKSFSRKSIALYFYTKDRPEEELADTHSTIYVDRPLPQRFQPGVTLTESDLQEVQILLARRDQHAQRLYRDLQALQTRFEQAQAALTKSTSNTSSLSDAFQRRLRYYKYRLATYLRSLSNL